MRANSWESSLYKIYNDITSRKKFSYDMNKDSFYKQYAERYTNNAKLAMQDTVAQASALTGGYANSYAATAGQAMYNQQMEGLNDKATELYGLALQTYAMESDRLNSIYSMTANNYAMEQDRINAEVAEEQWAADFAERQRQYDMNMAYQAKRDAVSDSQWAASYALDAQRQASSDAQWRAQMQYNQKRDAASDAQWEKEFDYQQQRDAVSDSQFAQEMAYKYANMDKSSSGSPSKPKPMSKAEYERTLESLPNDLRQYLTYGTAHVTNSDEIRARRVTAIKTATEREDNSISEETAKKLLTYYGYDY